MFTQKVKVNHGNAYGKQEREKINKRKRVNAQLGKGQGNGVLGVNELFDYVLMLEERIEALEGKAN